MGLEYSGNILFGSVANRCLQHLFEYRLHMKGYRLEMPTLKLGILFLQLPCDLCRIRLRKVDLLITCELSDIFLQLQRSEILPRFAA